MKYAAIVAGYRFTLPNGQPMEQHQTEKFGDRLFDLIGDFAAENGLLVEGAADFEHADVQEGG